MEQQQNFVRWFRDSTPYINAFRGRTFVVTFGGELLAEDQFAHLLEDLVLLNSLGVRLVLVHGARPQIETRLQLSNIKMHYANGLRITDEESLLCVKEAIGSVRVEVEAQLSMGLKNSPMAGADIRVVSGNFVTAQPLGVRDGIDYQHTGEVRRIDVEAIEEQLDLGAIVLLSPLGYSPTGEVFNLSAEDVATVTAVDLGADKLICLIDGPGLFNKEGELIHQLQLSHAQYLIENQHDIVEATAKALYSSLYACENGVRRAHLIDRHLDGALLMELFTRDGVGTLINTDAYEAIEEASIDDVGGILELIEPLEAEGIMVRRSRELLEAEISQFTVIKRDNTIIACAALYPYEDEQVGEIACFAVHPDYRAEGRGDRLLEHMEKLGKQSQLQRLFVLTTRTAHWFAERGFVSGTLKALPVKRQALYNYQRGSKVFIKSL
ncbi:MAG: amino-acid N-acetyltransferase [Gammaproteobacteria bacterium]|nr:amino-acid N-acetyltransferase [Gammaproteobacteria bacterium]